VTSGTVRYTCLNEWNEFRVKQVLRPEGRKKQPERRTNGGEDKTFRESQAVFSGKKSGKTLP